MDPAGQHPSHGTGRKSSSGSATKLQPHSTINCQELLQGAAHSGWLRKQAVVPYSVKKRMGRKSLSGLSKLLPWRKRYVVLCEGCLYQYSCETSSKPLGSLSLARFTRVTAAGEILQTDAPWAFKLIEKEVEDISSNVKYFSAGSEQEMKTWINEIEKQVKWAISRVCVSGTAGAVADSDSDGDENYDQIDSVLDNLKESSNAIARPRPLPQTPDRLAQQDSPTAVIKNHTLPFPEDRPVPPTPGQGKMLPVAPTRLRLPAAEPASPPPRTLPKTFPPRQGMGLTRQETFPPFEPVVLNSENHMDGMSFSVEDKEVSPLPVLAPRRTPVPVAAPHDSEGIYDNTEDPPEEPSPPTPASDPASRPTTPLPVFPNGAAAPKALPKLPPGPIKLKPVGQRPTPRPKPTLKPKVTGRMDSPNSSGDGTVNKAVNLWSSAAVYNSQEAAVQGAPGITWRDVFWSGGDKDACNQVIRELNFEGAYLVRKSEEHMTLVAWVEGTIKRYKILQEDANYFIKQDWKFPSILKLIEHYTKNCLPGYNAKLSLPYTQLL